MEGRKANSVRLLLIIFAVSLLARLMFGIVVMGLDAPPVSDAANYDQIGTSIVSEGRYIQYTPRRVWYSRRPPLLPFLLAAVYTITGHSFMASRLVMIVIGSFIPLVLFALTSRIFGRRAAVIAGFISAFYPFFLLYSNTLLTETPFVLLVSLLILFLVRFGQERRMSDIIIAGVVAGLGCLCRPTLLSFLPFSVLWILIVGRRELVRSLKAAGLFVLVTAVVITPWTVRNHRVHGEIVLVSSMGGSALWIGNNERATGNLGDDFEMLVKIMPDPGTTKETEIDRFYRREAIEFIRSHPKEFVLLGAKKLFHFWRPAGFRIPGLIEQTPERVRFAVGFFSFVPLFLLFLIGLLMWLRGLRLFRDPGLLLVALLIIVYTAIHAVYTSIPRYRQPLEPLIIAMASWVVVVILDWNRARSRAKTD